MLEDENFSRCRLGQTGGSCFKFEPIANRQYLQPSSDEPGIYAAVVISTMSTSNTYLEIENMLTELGSRNEHGRKHTSKLHCAVY